MLNRFFVVDQNYLRKPELEDILERDLSVQIVLTDSAFIEMTKNESREITLKKSLKILSKYSNRVIVSKALSEALQFELKFQKPVVNMHFKEASKFARQILLGLNEEIKNTELKRILDDPNNHLFGIKNDYLNHDFNKERCLTLVEVTMSQIDEKFNKKIISGLATDEDYLDISSTLAPNLFVSVLSHNGFNEKKSNMLIRKKPMLLRYFYLKIWASLKWKETQRLESLASKKVTNDLLDHDYILVATYFDGLLTDDQRMIEAYNALKKLLVKPIFFDN